MGGVNLIYYHTMTRDCHGVGRTRTTNMGGHGLNRVTPCASGPTPEES
jgi:hypothetical protein